jgi:hypothetical protein
MRVLVYGVRFLSRGLLPCTNLHVTNCQQLLVERNAAAAGTPYPSPSTASRAQKIADAHKWSQQYGGNIITQLKVRAYFLTTSTHLSALARCAALS